MAATTIKGQHVDIRLWTQPETVEDQAMRQLHNIAALPWTFKHVAVMPDVHYGCGMTAVRTSLTAEDLPASLGRLRGLLERAVPVGFAQHRTEAFTARDAEIGRAHV